MSNTCHTMHKSDTRSEAVHNLPEIVDGLGHHDGMSTRIGRFAREYCHPGLITALVKVAFIGTSKGRTFLDDDADFDDIADFVPAESPPALAAPAPGDAARGGSHPVAA